MRDIPALREVLQENNAMRVQLEHANFELAAERASIVDLKAEATRLVAELAKERASVAAVTAERDAAIKKRDVYVEIARGTATFACSGAVVLGAHTDHAVTRMFPAMLAGAIQLALGYGSKERKRGSDTFVYSPLDKVPAQVWYNTFCGQKSKSGQPCVLPIGTKYLRPVFRPGRTEFILCTDLYPSNRETDDADVAGTCMMWWGSLEVPARSIQVYGPAWL